MVEVRVLHMDTLHHGGRGGQEVKPLCKRLILCVFCVLCGGALRSWADVGDYLGRTVAAVTRPRPGHADLAGFVKYGHDDMRNVLERASARETAARVAIGAIARQLLRHVGTEIVSPSRRGTRAASQVGRKYSGQRGAFIPTVNTTPRPPAAAWSICQSSELKS